jgi:hypothetical protein
LHKLGFGFPSGSSSFTGEHWPTQVVETQRKFRKVAWPLRPEPDRAASNRKCLRFPLKVIAVLADVGGRVEFLRH